MNVIGLKVIKQKNYIYNYRILSIYIQECRVQNDKPDISNKHRKDELLNNVRKMDRHLERINFDPYIIFNRSNCRTY